MTRSAMALALAVGCSMTTLAHAENKQADALFKKGKRLLAEKRFADACDAFKRSNELDPGIGAMLNVAKCFEDWGKIATALKWYRDAEKAARDASDPRLDKIHERVEEVDGDTPRLTLQSSNDADPDAIVTLDGMSVKLDVAIEVDPGAHVVEYTADTGERKKKVIPVERGGTSEVKLDLPKRKAGKAGKPKGTALPEPADPGRTRRIIGIVVGSVGIAGIGVASYLTLDARSTYKDALGMRCGGSPSMCDPTGLQITHDARSQANLATVIGGIGLAAVAGGIVLYLTAPSAVETPETETEKESTAWYITPSLDRGGGGIVFGGRY